MERKSEFRQEEITNIRNLISSLKHSNREEQKKIRNKIRKIGFYISDYKSTPNNVNYTVEEFDNLIKSGIIRVIGKPTTNLNKFHATSGKQVEHLANITVKSKVAASDAKSEDVKIGLAPWIGENPKVLILGSLPGDESLKQQAYYANNLNSFWKIMRELFNTNMESDNKKFITSCGIALWDCADSAERKGSLDSAIVNSSVVANDIKALLLEHPTIQTIIFNGGKAEKFYHTYCSGIECKTIRLISTSSAAARRFEDKLKEWSIITELVK